MVAEPSLGSIGADVLLNRIDPEFGLAGTVLALALIVWLALVVPMRGCRNYRIRVGLSRTAGCRCLRT
jgi:hypothetical protein